MPTSGVAEKKIRDLQEQTRTCLLYDFFETIKEKSTSYDSPEPEWKYMSHFAVSNGKKVNLKVTTRAQEPQEKQPHELPLDMPQEHPVEFSQAVDSSSPGRNRSIPHQLPKRQKKSIQKAVPSMVP